MNKLEEARKQAEALYKIAKKLGYYHWEHFLEDHDTPVKLFNAGVEYAKQLDQRNQLREAAEKVVRYAEAKGGMGQKMHELCRELEKALK